MRIHYISYGISETGGYKHEVTLFDAVVKYMEKTRVVKAVKFRKNKLFGGIFAYVELLIWSFFRSNAHVNIVTARTGIPAMLRNLFNKNKVWIVIHNFDPADGKSTLLKWYYKRMFLMLAIAKHQRFKVIVEAPFWEKYFKETLSISNTCLFPNLFDLSIYMGVKLTKNSKLVNLGQFSSKNDPDIIKLAKKLSLAGYDCYFTTPDQGEAREHNGSFSITHFHSLTAYLERMSESLCTLALTRINEGWNRIAHESLLVGTPVIGYDKGGLGDLLKESKSLVVRNIDEAYTGITESKLVLPEISFKNKYNIVDAENYVIQICSI